MGVDGGIATQEAKNKADVKMARYLMVVALG